MKNILILITILILTSCENREKKEVIREPTTEQKAKYAELTDKASQLYSTKDYQKSAQKFSEAFKVFGDKSTTTDRYDAACSWALANQSDSSFVQLFKASEKGGYSRYNHIIADTDLSNLRSHKN